jgi:hypothetical protein
MRTLSDYQTLHLTFFLQAVINSFHVDVLAAVEKAALYIEVGGLIIIVVTVFSIAGKTLLPELCISEFQCQSGHFRPRRTCEGRGAPIGSPAIGDY